MTHQPKPMREAFYWMTAIIVIAILIAGCTPEKPRWKEHLAAGNWQPVTGYSDYMRFIGEQDE